jgi:hypothetical protein
MVKDPTGNRGIHIKEFQKILMLHQHFTHFEPRDLLVERFHHHSLFLESIFPQQEEYNE